MLLMTDKRCISYIYKISLKKRWPQYTMIIIAKVIISEEQVPLTVSIYCDYMIIMQHEILGHFKQQTLYILKSFDITGVFSTL